ncbi:MAG: tetratricopeptide repeat protein, partial [Verrucomicrobiia bacterium]
RVSQKTFPGPMFIRRRMLPVWQGGLIILLVFLAYLPALRGGFVWDDDVYVTNNPLLTAPDGLRRIWFSMDSPSQYFPLTYTVFRIEHLLWGLNPTGYHSVNILLHAINALLVWLLLKRLSVPGAWLAAALFGLHPVQVESVAWITELKSVLSLFFILLTLGCWIEFVGDRSRRFWHWLALMFYALALFSKTTACTLPAALLLILWLKGRPIDWRRLAQVVPFLAMGLGMGLLTTWWERFRHGTQGKLFSMGLLERILVASHALWFYAGKLLWPVNLTFSYPRWAIEPAHPSAYGWLLMGIGSGAAIYFTRRFVGRSVEVAALFYVATLSPLLGFVMFYTFRYTFVADHYQYVASLGLIALAAAGITLAFKTKPFLKLACCGALLLTLGTLTWRQCGMYTNLETLWRKTLAKNPDCWMAHNNLGLLLSNQGRNEEAMEHYRKAVQIDPNDFEALYNLGIALAAQGQFNEAIENFRKAIQIKPNDCDALNNLGIALAAQGRFDEAFENFRKAIQIDPNDCDALDNLGTALAERGQFDEAIENYHKAIQINSNRPQTFFHLGTTLGQSGRTREAVVQYREALKLNPNLAGALNNLAWILASNPDDELRNGAEAVRLAERACELTHYGQPVYIGTLAAAYAEARRFGEAVETAQRALNLPATQNNKPLADALQMRLKLYESSAPFHEKP